MQLFTILTIYSLCSSPFPRSFFFRSFFSLSASLVARTKRQCSIHLFDIPSRDAEVGGQILRCRIPQFDDDREGDQRARSDEADRSGRGRDGRTTKRTGVNGERTKEKRRKKEKEKINVSTEQYRSTHSHSHSCNNIATQSLARTNATHARSHSHLHSFLHSIAILSHCCNAIIICIPHHCH